jgi:hypothetical protein
MHDSNQMAKQLQEALAKRRPRPWWPVLLALTGSTLFLLFLAWYLYPRPQPEPLQVIPLDGVFTPDEAPFARAQLLALAEKDEHRLEGQTLVFVEAGPIGRPGVQPRELKSQSDAHGQASVEWRDPEFLVHYINTTQGHGSPFQRGRLYVWPADSPVLVVDVDETLHAAELDEQASKTLQQAAQEGWRIIYAAVKNSKGGEFLAARDWIENQTRLPRGPILGRTYYPHEMPPLQARRELLQSLRKRFRGPFVFIARNEESGRLGTELGLRAVTLGSTATPAWGDVRLQP